MIRWTTWLIVSVLLLALLPGSLPARAETQKYPLDECRDGAFSTEEDFMASESKPYDGDPYISDGDVLSRNGQVCARNRDLLAAFSVGARLPDLGLDALEIVNITERSVAFSTEIDDPDGRFTAGDLLFTTGAVVPNIALVHNFGVNADVGLDSVQFIGKREGVRQFVSALSNISRDDFVEQPDRLQALLRELGIDILFSIEGTWGTAEKPSILDGDLLSASGSIVAKNDTLLPAGVPAGIPVRGIDYGLDATYAEDATNLDVALRTLHFSTEILYPGGQSFNDGDVIKYGNGVAIRNEDLVKPFGPAADFLGLDALSLGQTPVLQPGPMITMIGNQSVWDIDGGFVPVNAAGSGLYAATAGVEPQRPFGWYVPIDGYLPADTTEYRIAFRPVGTLRPAPDIAPGINTTWNIQNWTGFLCQYNATFADNGQGWFDYGDYVNHRNIEFCIDGGLVLAVWDTLNDPNVGDRNGHYVVWLEWKTTTGGAAVFQEPVDHHVQLDNQPPAITQFELRTPDNKVVEPCDGAPAGQNTLRVFAEITDNYFGGYRVSVRGGKPPATIWYPSPAGWHSFWDGTAEVANLNGQGTTPAGIQFLREIDMTDFGASYTSCCYDIDLRVNDRAIRHNFNQRLAYPDQPGWAWPYKFQTFAASP